MAEVIVFHKDKKLHFKDLDADHVAYLTQANDLQATATPRRGAMLSPCYTEEQVEAKFLELGEYLQEITASFAPAYRIGRKDIKNWYKNNK